MIKNSRGTISIFLALILLPVYSFAILTMDIVRLVISNNHLNQANEIACYSIESSFNDKLHEKYGIFGIDSDKDNLNQYVNYILKENIEKDTSNVYQAMLEEANFEVDNNDLLLSNQNLEKQILEHMKLMGPYEMANGVINLINVVMSSKKYTEVLNNKLDYEEEYSKSLKNLDNLSNNFILYDNNFNKVNNDVNKLNTRLQTLIKNIKDIKSKFVAINIIEIDKDTDLRVINEKANKLLGDNQINVIIELYKLTSKDEKKEENIDFINLLKKNKDFIDKIYSYSKIWKINDKLQVDEKDFDISIALDKIFKYNSEIEKFNNNIINKFIHEYNSENNDLIQILQILEKSINDIVDELEILKNDTKLLQEKLDKWGNSVNNLDQSEIKNNLSSDYKSTKIMFTKENITKLLDKLSQHKDTIPIIIKEIYNNIFLFKVEAKNIDMVINQNVILKDTYKLPSLNNFKLYKFAIDQNKDIKIDKVKRNIAKKNKNNIEKFGTNNKKNTVDKSRESIFSYINKENINKITKITKENNNINHNNNIDNYRNILNLTYRIIPSNQDNLIDNLFISQYIIDKFYNKLSNNEGFSNQIEYILFGNDKLSSNNNQVNNYIFGIRFLLNTIYAYTNTDLKLEANAIAIAIAGWTGFATPLIRSLVLSAMTFGETVLDLEKINNNKYIETFKNKSSWQVSVSSIPTLLAKEAKDIINSSLENIYDSIINFSNQGIGFLKNNVDEFANQTINGIAQSIISEIVSPLQITIFNNINKINSDFESQIRESLNNISLSIESNKDNLYPIKKSILEYVRSNILSNINSFDQINLDQYFYSISSEIENRVKSYTEKYSHKLKEQIKSSVSENKIKQKELFNKYIDDYLKNVGMNKKITNMGSTSGLSFKYKDYLVLVTLFRLLTGNKNQILERVALVMDYEMKKTNIDFDITNVFVSFSIDSKLKTNTSILNKYIFKDMVESTIHGGY